MSDYAFDLQAGSHSQLSYTPPPSIMLEYETDIGAKEIILREIHSTPSITIKDLAKACGLSVAGTNYIDQLKSS